jgi:hypothetical protein
MGDWKSCENCRDQECYEAQAGLFTEITCECWEPIRCRCGGALSEIREHNGKRYRHCYSCHFEFEEE